MHDTLPISCNYGKHKHFHDRVNKNHRKDETLSSDHSTHKWRKLTSKQKSHHQTPSRNHLDKHQRSKKLALPQEISSSHFLILLEVISSKQCSTVGSFTIMMQKV